MSFDYKQPRPSDICAFIERLAEMYKSPSTIRNNISAVKTYMAIRGRSVKPFENILVKNALRAVDIQVRHVPRQRLPITPAQLSVIISIIIKRRNGNMMALALIIMFQAFLRQSNIFPRTVASFDATRHITFSDISRNKSSITIAVKWSKTQQKLGEHQNITLHALPGSPLCPVTAYDRAMKTRQRATTEAPLITFNDGNPITTGYIKREWARALTAASLPPHMYSLHSLRRGGASFTYYKGGASLSDVIRHGGWSKSSQCVRAYLKPPAMYKDTVHRALDTL